MQTVPKSMKPASKTASNPRLWIGAICFVASTFGITESAQAQARVCKTFATPQTPTARPIRTTTFGTAGGVSEENLSSVPTLRVTQAASVETPGTNSQPAVSGGGGGRINYNNRFAPDAAFGLDPYTTEYTFERAMNIRVVAGGSFGGPTTAMDRSHDRLTFQAVGATPGFTWQVNGLVAATTTIVISPDGQTLTVNAPSVTNPRTFAEFDFQTDGQITGFILTHEKPAGSNNNNANFTLRAPECVIETDLLLTKTNTPGVNGDVDQTGDTVTSGAATTYTITVTNNGPNPATGALVTDTVVAGLTCPAANAVTITGDGVPAGSFTVADLTGAGITLGTLAVGDATALTFDCVVS